MCVAFAVESFRSRSISKPFSYVAGSAAPITLNAEVIRIPQLRAVSPGVG